MVRDFIYADEDMVPLIPILSESGHALAEAYSSVEVVNLLLHESFDLVIIPDRAEPTDADELLPLVRRLTRATLVVAGDRDEMDLSMALMQGADHYLKLPDDKRNVREGPQSLDERGLGALDRRLENDHFGLFVVRNLQPDLRIGDDDCIGVWPPEFDRDAYLLSSILIPPDE